VLFVHKLLYSGFFSRAGNFRVFRIFLENCENIQPRKCISAKKNLRGKKGQTKITFRKKKDEDFSPQCVWLCFRAMVRAACYTERSWRLLKLALITKIKAGTEMKRGHLPSITISMISVVCYDNRYWNSRN